MGLLGKKKWLYTLEEDKKIFTGLKPTHDVVTPWGTLDTEGWLHGKAGYSWDGCSPKWIIGSFLPIGTPDGVWDNAIQRPVMYYPSYIHDFGYQFRKELEAAGITKNDIDLAFWRLARAHGAARWAAAVYYGAVKYFGFVAYYT